jgi:hypothetical protein
MLQSTIRIGIAMNGRKAVVRWFQRPVGVHDPKLHGIATVGGSVLR